MKKNVKSVYLYDTTLRDGAQGEGVSFSLEDKLKIAKKCEELEIDYVEGGWPGSNPKDVSFFREVKKLSLVHTKIAAFGSTRHANVAAKKDANLNLLLDAKTPVLTIFGKSWDLHVTEALRTTLEENLQMVYDSVVFLRKNKREVIYDAEHFFDGYKRNPSYALKTIKAAQEGGCHWVVLCDTNGGTLTHEMENILRGLKKHLKVPFGVHTHNDADCAVANTLCAVKLGATQVQGTLNGIGERCGNANLCSIIPSLKLKMGKLNVMSDEALKKLTEVSRYVDEVANIVPRDNAPYVGRSAFAHKGGMHVSAVTLNPETYQHVEPERLGNTMRVLTSELSGKATVLYKAEEFNIDLSSKSDEVRKIVETLKTMENEGYQFEGAEASFDLLIKKMTGKYKELFSLKGFRMIIERRNDGRTVAEATVKLDVGGKQVHVVSEGDGPVNALDNALRKALQKFYPGIKNIRLQDFKVRVLDGAEGTAAKVRVLIETADEKEQWGTVGVSENIIEASWQALVDSIEYGLLRARES